MNDAAENPYASPTSVADQAVLPALRKTYFAFILVPMFVAIGAVSGWIVLHNPFSDDRLKTDWPDIAAGAAAGFVVGVFYFVARIRLVRNAA